MVQNRPLYDNEADAPLFVRPAAWGGLERAMARHLNVLLVGRRGSGKTTVLRQLQAKIRGENTPAYFVDATALDDLDELVGRVRDIAVGRPSPLSETAQQFAAMGRSGSARSPAGVSLNVHGMLTSIGQAPAGVFLVDATQSSKVLFELFGRLRDVLWQQSHRWVVAIDVDDEGAVFRPPADAFFDIRLEIGALSSGEIEDLLVRRESSMSNSAVQLVAKAAEGNPRAAVRAMNELLVEGQDPNELAHRRLALIEAASVLGRSQAMLMTELLERGQASPSDEGLQESLGMSRARLTAYLRDLLEYELVSAERERSDGPGRPRTVYKPKVDR